MAKTSLLQDKENTLDNLKAIRMTLQECIDEGMMDENDRFYNELGELIDQAHLIQSYPELAEVIIAGKSLETDIDAWLSMRRRETLSLNWPKGL